ncbi:hypothetical protein [Azospirillum largimobile]
MGGRICRRVGRVAKQRRLSSCCAATKMPQRCEVCGFSHIVTARVVRILALALPPNA